MTFQLDADTVAGVDGFVTSSCNNNNPGSDNGIVAFLYLYLRYTNGSKSKRTQVPTNRSFTFCSPKELKYLLTLVQTDLTDCYSPNGSKSERTEVLTD